MVHASALLFSPHACIFHRSGNLPSLLGSNLLSPACSFTELAQGLGEAEETILRELIDCQGPPVDLGGYFKPDPTKTQEAMRPSVTFNQLIDV